MGRTALHEYSQKTSAQNHGVQRVRDSSGLRLREITTQPGLEVKTASNVNARLG